MEVEVQEQGVGTFAGPGADVAGGVLTVVEALWDSELEQQEVGRDGVGSGEVEAD